MKIEFEIDENMYNNVISVLQNDGLDVNIAINIFLNKLVNAGTISFLFNNKSQDIERKDNVVLCNNIQTSKMTKNLAKRLFSTKGIIFNNNCVFASENSSTHIFWANIHYEILSKDWYLILNDKSKEVLCLFFIPANEFCFKDFVMRADKPEIIDLQIAYNDPTFTDNRSKIEFRRYLVDSINYGRIENTMEESLNMGMYFCKKCHKPVANGSICGDCQNKLKGKESYTLVTRSNKYSNYLVNQTVTFGAEINNGIVWAPLQYKGNTHYSWSILKDLKIGDKVFNSRHGKIEAISIVTERAIISKFPDAEKFSEELKDPKYKEDGWLVKCEYKRFSKPLKLNDYMGAREKFGGYRYAPFNKDGGYNEGYMFPLCEELANLFEKEINRIN